MIFNTYFEVPAYLFYIERLSGATFDEMYFRFKFNLVSSFLSLLQICWLIFFTCLITPFSFVFWDFIEVVQNI